MTNIALIPVRSGSKSIPFKNIKPLAGKPLVYWVTKAASGAKCIDKVIIATDGNEIKNVVKEFQMNKIEIYDREPQNAKDDSSTESVILEYINKSDCNQNDCIFLIQATSPLLQANDIDNMYVTMIKENSDSALSCVRCKRFFWSKDGIPLNYDYKNRPRRQDFEGFFMENGACYINSVKNILTCKNRLFGKISVYEMPDYTSIEIDEPDDFILVEKLMEKLGYV